MTEISTFSFRTQTLTTSRVIAHLKGGAAGPKVVFIAGMHGNEPTGVIALKEMLLHLDQEQINGEIIALVGNMEALSNGRRFIDRDLNRLWTKERIGKMRKGELNGEMSWAESKEQLELLDLLDEFIETDETTYFIDLHTTSAPSSPFMSISATAENKEFAGRFRVPAIVGIEDYIKGPLLDYMSVRGHVALAFEAGQHVSPDSVLHHKTFIGNVLSELGVTHREKTRFEISSNVDGLFEIVHREEIAQGAEFEMKPGYVNFQTIEKGELLATDSRGDIYATDSGRIFMPLYQKEGSDGFFIIR